MLSESIEFPRNGESWKRIALIGGILTLLSPLILPGILLYGYLVRCLRCGVRGETVPPHFDEWPRMFAEGVGFIAIPAVYFITPNIVTPVLTDIGFAEPPGSALRIILGVVVILIGLGIFALFFILPAAWARFAHEERWLAAFQFRELAASVLSTDYVLGVIVAIGIGISIGLLGMLLLVIVIGVFILFYGQMAIFWSLGRGYGAASNIST